MRSTYGWGLIGPGRFAREFADELRKNKRVNCVGVASRNIDRATCFAREFGFERAYGSYEEIMTDNEVDIIYVVVPHIFHRKIAEMALKSGKAVLCEKPLTQNYLESLETIKTSKDCGVFLMEAMKTGFLPAIKRSCKWVFDGEIGIPKILKADFCFSGSTDPEDRLMNPNLGGGAVLDIGVYPIYLARRFLGEIVSVSAEGSITETGVEDSAVISTRHANGALGSLTCSFQTDAEAMGAEILGTRGSIQIPFFHKATEANLVREGKLIERYEDKSGGMVNAEIEAVMNSLDRGEMECPDHTHADSLSLAQTSELVREAILKTSLSGNR